MKLKALLITLFIAMTSSAFAQFFPARAFVTVLPLQVSTEVYNPYYEPIVCSGEVFGQTIRGPVFHTFFAQQLMPAGSYRYAVVNTNGYNTFIGGWSNINCRFARW